jgi:hypothetical protein
VSENKICIVILKRRNLQSAVIEKILNHKNDAKRVIKSCKSQMDRQYSGQMKKNKANKNKKNNVLQNATQQTVDLATATSLKRIMNSGMQ